MCFKTDRDQKSRLSSEIEPLQDKKPSKSIDFPTKSLCKLQWEINGFWRFFILQRLYLRAQTRFLVTVSFKTHSPGLYFRFRTFPNDFRAISRYRDTFWAEPPLQKVSQLYSFISTMTLIRERAEYGTTDVFIFPEGPYRI